MTLSGMLLNFGLRLDYWAPGSFVDDIAQDTSSALIISKALRQSYLDNTLELFGQTIQSPPQPASWHFTSGIGQPDTVLLVRTFLEAPGRSSFTAKLNQSSVRSSPACRQPEPES
ncbi:MAG: hypothetical protein MZV64_31550 [Ignavibacteriales bacterium]|nr:hypothetical protein [Ignavibacteriales bacterium]